MLWSEIKSVIEAEGSGTYAVTLTNGQVIKLRLFISSGGEVSEFKKGSSRRGHSLGYVLSSDSITSLKREITSKDRKEPSYDAFIRNLRKLSKYLSISGMWKHILDSAENILSMSDDDKKKFYERLQSENRPAGMSWMEWYDDTYRFCKERGIALSLDELHALCRPSGIKTVNYQSVYGYSSIHKLVQTALQDAKEGKTTDNNWSEKVTFHRSFTWRKNYDITLSIDQRTDIGLVGHYSEEYRNCGNGYYYILLDDKHVMFCEKD